MAWSNSVPLDYIEQAVNMASQEFIKGFIAGQCVLLILLFVIIEKSEAQAVNSKPWNEALIDMIIQEYRQSDKFHLLLCDKLSKIMDPPSAMQQKRKLPPFIDTVRITSISLGNSFPTIAPISNFPCSLEQIFVPFTWKNSFNISLETNLLLNWPKIAMASLPLVLSVTVNSVEGLFYFRIKDGQLVSSMRNVHLTLQVNSVLGHRTKVKDLPKVAAVVVGKAKKAILDALEKERLIKLPFLNSNK